MKLKKWFEGATLLAVTTFGLAACSSSTSKNARSANSATVTAKVGVMSLSDTRRSTLEQGSEVLDKDKAGVKLGSEFTVYSA